MQVHMSNFKIRHTIINEHRAPEVIVLERSMKQIFPAGVGGKRNSTEKSGRNEAEYKDFFKARCQGANDQKFEFI